MESKTFEKFLNDIEVIMRSKPTDSNDGIKINYDKIRQDMQEFNNFQDQYNQLTMAEQLKLFIKHKQSNIEGGLTPESLSGFEEYPRFEQLKSMATEGCRPFCKPDFKPNKGEGDFDRTTQREKLKHTIAQHIRKLQDKGHCLIFQKEMLQGVEGVHVSALHVACKESDTKGRPCTDATHSGLNEGTDMEQLTEYLGEYKLPQLKALARMLKVAKKRGHTLLHKTDVSSAFNCMYLHPDAALLQIFQVGEMLILPLVAGFGWAAAPAYYNVIAGAIDWAHNGGISSQRLDAWTFLQGESLSPRGKDNKDRSITYVDDSCGHSSIITVCVDMCDLKIIIRQLLGMQSYNDKKTEGPKKKLTIIGWECDMETYTIRPGVKGFCKLYYWTFRGLKTNKSIPVHDLHSAVSTLRWYSAVIPLASTFELQRLLTETQRRQTKEKRLVFCKLRKSAQRELEWWQWLLTENLKIPMLDSPVWYLAKDFKHKEVVTIYTDASGEIGGGYYIPKVSFGQFLWSNNEKDLYGIGEYTDINGLEFVTAVCTIICNREFLRNKIVRIFVDNTSAVTWLNKRRTSSMFGQTWMRLLISVMIEFEIILDCVHIAGKSNTIADSLSRFLQTQETQSLKTTCEERQVMSAESREIIWSMSSTPLAHEEYLTILRKLEAQDSITS